MLLQNIGCLYFLFVLGLHPKMLKGYSWLCSQETFLVGSGDHTGIAGIEASLATSKVNSLSAVLLLWPHFFFLVAE